MSEIPEIRIRFSHLLYDTISKDAYKLYATKGEKLDSVDYFEKRAQEYRQAWQPYGPKILDGMTEALGLMFYKDVIDATLVPWVRAVSTPLIINFRRNADEFIDLLAHELLHILLTDNKIISTYSTDVDLVKEWSKLYKGNHSPTTIIHIPIHACLKYIYLDILGQPNRLERDIESCKPHEEYAVAWQYVETNDYKKIIDDLRSMYRDLKK